jgi:hypothetical protein
MSSQAHSAAYNHLRDFIQDDIFDTQEVEKYVRPINSMIYRFIDFRKVVFYDVR